MTPYYLLLLLFFCHFLADFTHLSTAWMLKAKRFGSPVLPILAHAGVHALLMGIVLAFYVPITTPAYWNLVLWYQLISHFLIDLSKGQITKQYLCFQDSSNKWF